MDENKAYFDKITGSELGGRVAPCMGIFKGFPSPQKLEYRKNLSERLNQSGAAGRDYS